ncbi:hypothetical protein HanXRQr2_Chr09g0366561 [Helianthus annuus]|uniref:Uncharacterized protein n=1 Tax=Helianthus annuus TaxID=4232 RepID=A0A9K3I2H0_HELAN|nr:hypothetical protein HanXRQr2_Chr09g0366561 [Helianthus annuus]
MAGAMLKEGHQRQLEVNEFHNQAGYLSNPPADQAELFGSLIRGLNNCPLTHALKTNPVMCSNCINSFWNNAKIGRQGASHIESTIQKTKIIISEDVIREVLRFGDQPDHPTVYDQARVQTALRRKGYEGGYPTVLKKLFPPYWRLLVHFFLQCIAENKGGWDQMNKTKTSAVVALVNGWDYNFSAFIFDNMKKMLEDPKKKIFMLYPRFIQMILDERYPSLVKGSHCINLKPMGPGCFENACRNKRARHHNFEGLFPLEKHGRFADNVQAAPVAPVAPVPPVIPVAPVPPPVNGQIAEEHDPELLQQTQQIGDDEEEFLTINSESDTLSSEESDFDSEMEIVTSEKAEDTVRKPVPISAENLAALLLSIKGGNGDPPSISTPVIQEMADVPEESAQKKQRTDNAPDSNPSGLSFSTEPSHTANPPSDPQTTDASKKINQEDTYLYDLNFDFEATLSQPGSSSGGVQFEAGSSSGVHLIEHDEAAFRYASEKRQVSDSDSDEEEYVKRLKRRVVVLEQENELKSAQIVSLQQDAALKEVQISSLQSQLTNRDSAIDQLQGDVGMLMTTVYSLKAKLEKKFGGEFIDKEDEQFHVGRSEETPE